MHICGNTASLKKNYTALHIAVSLLQYACLEEGEQNDDLNNVLLLHFLTIGGWVGLVIKLYCLPAVEDIEVIDLSILPSRGVRITRLITLYYKSWVRKSSSGTRISAVFLPRVVGRV